MFGVRLVACCLTVACAAISWLRDQLCTAGVRALYGRGVPHPAGQQLLPAQLHPLGPHDHNPTWTVSDRPNVWSFCDGGACYRQKAWCLCRDSGLGGSMVKGRILLSVSLYCTYTVEPLFRTRHLLYCPSYIHRVVYKVPLKYGHFCSSKGVWII